MDQKLPLTLAEQFKQAGGEIKMGHRLVRFVPKHADGALAIDLDVWDAQSKVMRYYRCAALILAMPQRSLELISNRHRH